MIITYLNNILKKGSGINFHILGINNDKPKWNYDFYKEMMICKMSLKLSRGKPLKYASSNRIASLMGNGLLTFVDKKTELDDMFNNKEIVMYENINDLTNKINFYKKNNHLRSKIASAGRKKYFKLINELKTTKYIIDKSLGREANLY